MSARKQIQVDRLICSRKKTNFVRARAYMGRARKLALVLACSLAVVLLLLPPLCTAALGDTARADGGGGGASLLRRPRFHYESGYLYIADAYMGPMRVGPEGYLYMRRHCTPWVLTDCPLASRMELSLLRG